MKLITTSWDDGAENDLRLAELLHKYNIKATFYVPQSNAERKVLSESQIQQLSQEFEIGGHTLHHLRLNHIPKAAAKNEIEGSYNWLTDILQKKPYSFCFPGGNYNKHLITLAYNTGYKLLRSTELLNSSLSIKDDLLATTIQVFPHRQITYFKHLLKRRRTTNLLQWMKSGRLTDLEKLTELHLEKIRSTGGCFHLWGHSWEIEQYNLWNKLEEIFKIISSRPDFLYLENRHLLSCMI